MVDFTIWNDLLQQYVDEQGRVDYAAWKERSRPQLHQWLNNIQSVDLQASQASQQLAFWLNLYNAVTIAQVLDRYPIASIRPTILGIPNWIAFLQFFSHPVCQLGDQFYSLNAIEHTVLRKQFTEPRIHFALVCASVGCPLLRNQAYQPDTVQSQLEEDAKRFINNPAKVHYDTDAQTLYCSKIFKWYRQDFLKVASSVPAYVKQYLSTSNNLTDSTRIRYLPYDWSLNQRTSS